MLSGGAPHPNCCLSSAFGFVKMEDGAENSSYSSPTSWEQIYIPFLIKSIFNFYLIIIMYVLRTAE